MLLLFVLMMMAIVRGDWYSGRYLCIDNCGRQYTAEKEDNQPLAAAHYYTCTDLCRCVYP